MLEALLRGATFGAALTLVYVACDVYLCWRARRRLERFRLARRMRSITERKPSNERN